MRIKNKIVACLPALMVLTGIFSATGAQAVSSCANSNCGAANTGFPCLCGNSTIETYMGTSYCCGANNWAYSSQAVCNSACSPATPVSKTYNGVCVLSASDNLVSWSKGNGSSIYDMAVQVAVYDSNGSILGHTAVISSELGLDECRTSEQRGASSSEFAKCKIKMGSAKAWNCTVTTTSLNRDPISTNSYSAYYNYDRVQFARLGQSITSYAFSYDDTVKITGAYVSTACAKAGETPVNPFRLCCSGLVAQTGSGDARSVIAQTCAVPAVGAAPNYDACGLTKMNTGNEYKFPYGLTKNEFTAACSAAQPYCMVSCTDASAGMHCVGATCSSNWYDCTCKCCPTPAVAGPAACTPKACATLGNYTCGSWSDGCGGVINCGICATGQTCKAGVCVSSTSQDICIPKTCATLGNLNCGNWNDGCSNFVSCGTCVTGQACTAGQCTNQTAPITAPITAPAVSNTGLTLEQVQQLINQIIAKIADLYSQLAALRK